MTKKLFLRMYLALFAVGESSSSSYYSNLPPVLRMSLLLLEHFSLWVQASILWIYTRHFSDNNPNEKPVKPCKPCKPCTSCLCMTIRSVYPDHDFDILYATTTPDSWLEEKYRNILKGHHTYLEVESMAPAFQKSAPVQSSKVAQHSICATCTRHLWWYRETWKDLWPPSTSYPWSPSNHFSPSF